MKDQTCIRLKHMLDASQAALVHIAGKNREDLDTNRTILSALVRELEIIGEAQIQFLLILGKSTLKFRGNK
jgi:uncharacterized protein with HEPN domain